MGLAHRTTITRVATPDKTALLLLGVPSQLDAYKADPLLLCGAPVPGTLLKKWVGILWDHNLSFEPFLADRIKAARAAFYPLCALAREGLAPLAEVRSAMLAKVNNALFYGSMFLFLIPSAAASLTDLQLEFERALMGAPSWFSSSLLRATGGWQLPWGDRLLIDALGFRAELWCCKEGMLVRTVWAAAQGYPGRTFAHASKAALLAAGLPEIFDYPGWCAFMADGTPVLPHVLSWQMVKALISEQSILKW